MTWIDGGSPTVDYRRTETRGRQQGQGSLILAVECDIHCGTPLKCMPLPLSMVDEQ